MKESIDFAGSVRLVLLAEISGKPAGTSVEGRTDFLVGESAHQAPVKSSTAVHQDLPKEIPKCNHSFGHMNSFLFAARNFERPQVRSRDRPCNLCIGLAVLADLPSHTEDLKVLQAHEQ